MKEAKYTKENIIDFIENDETKFTWGNLVEMLFDKFGDEISELLHGICEKTEYEYIKITKDEKVKLSKIVEILETITV